MKISRNNEGNAGSSLPRSPAQVTTFITVLPADLLSSAGNNEPPDLSRPAVNPI